MADLEAYKSLAAFLNKDEVASDDMMNVVQLGYRKNEIVFNYNNVDYDLASDWDDEIHRYDEDKPQYWFWQFDKKDEYAIFVEGYYDSWAGSELSEHEYKVGKVIPHVVTYTGFEEIN
jgi:hypothetical protein